MQAREFRKILVSQIKKLISAKCKCRRPNLFFFCKYFRIFSKYIKRKSVTNKKNPKSKKKMKDLQDIKILLTFSIFHSENYYILSYRMEKRYLVKKLRFFLYYIVYLILQICNHSAFTEDYCRRLFFKRSSTNSTDKSTTKMNTFSLKMTLVKYSPFRRYSLAKFTKNYGIAILI